MRKESDDVILYDEHNIALAPWPDTAEGRWARAYLTPLVREGTRRFFSDGATVRVVGIDDLLIPLVIGEAERGGSYLVSTSGRYVDHPRAALSQQRGVGPLLMRRGLALIGGALEAARIDRCVYVNNWLIFRASAPPLATGQIERLTDFLVRTFPDHAVVFPTVNPITSHGLAGVLTRAGYSLLYAGHTRILLPHGAPMSRQERENRRRDARLLEESGYEVARGEDVHGCAPRLAELYDALNRRKYATNVGIHEEFIERAIRDGIMTVRVLRRGDRIDGFYGYVVNDGLMFSPVFGYDTSLPQEIGLYRMLVYRLVQDALDLGLASETGAGADRFKSVRGDAPVPRYGAYYVDHLPALRRMAWEALRAYVNGPYWSMSRAAVKRVDGDKAKGFDSFPPVFSPPPVTPLEAAAALREEVRSLRQSMDEAEALEGDALARSLRALSEKLDNWPYSTRLVEGLKERLAGLDQRARRQRKAREESGSEASLAAAAALIDRAERRGAVALVLGDLGAAPPHEIRAAAIAVLQGAPSAAVLVAATHGGKAVLVAAMTPDLIARGLTAGALMEAVAPEVGGSGGGKPNMAFGGGPRAAAIPAALAAARSHLEARLPLS